MFAVSLWNYVWQELGFRIKARSKFCQPFACISLDFSRAIRNCSQESTACPFRSHTSNQRAGPGFTSLLLLIRKTNGVSAGRLPNRQRCIWPIFNPLENCRPARAAPILDTVSSRDTAAPPDRMACRVSNTAKNGASL